MKRYKACGKDYFMIVQNKYIELRKPNGEYIHSICCKKCANNLIKIIKILKEKSK